MTTATTPDLGAAQRFLDALGAADWDGLAAALAADVRLRALVPSALREEEGAEAVAARYKLWFGELEDLRLVESLLEPVAGQVHVLYRIAGTDPEDGPVFAEQHCYLTVDGGQVAVINSVCSGFQPSEP